MSPARERLGDEPGGPHPARPPEHATGTTSGHQFFLPLTQSLDLRAELNQVGVSL